MVLLWHFSCLSRPCLDKVRDAYQSLACTVRCNHTSDFLGITKGPYIEHYSLYGLVAACMRPSKRLSNLQVLCPDLDGGEEGVWMSDELESCAFANLGEMKVVSYITAVPRTIRTIQYTGNQCLYCYNTYTSREWSLAVVHTRTKLGMLVVGALSVPCFTYSRFNHPTRRNTCVS